ncbi:MAG: M56 family metallopeptidase [Bacteroidetes bacterium]|nr:M56 family metallopeptidase [Bacteroidota bacterium]
MNALRQLLSDEMIQAICWTLIHSLWQGLLVAIACGIVIVFTRKSSSALRYNLLSFLFFLFLVIAGFTFSKELKSASGKEYRGTISAIANNIAQTNITQQQEQVSSLVTQGKHYIREVANYLSAHALLVVVIWFIIFSVRFVKLLADIGYAHRIRHYRINSSPAYWQAKVMELSDRLQIKKNILLLESEIVKVPLMTGFLKPVILFPFGLLMKLPAEQVEAVLLHELAHIKRKDYLVNLAQSFAEAIFFFNPGVLWISSLIREERENCCDDIAINHTKNKKQFVSALVAFQEYNIKNSSYAIAFPGKKNQLLQRAKRILQNDNKTLNIMQKIFLTSGLVVTGLLTVVFAQNHKRPPMPPKPEAITKEAVQPVAAIDGIANFPKEIAGVPQKPEPVESFVKAAASLPPVGEAPVAGLLKRDTLPYSYTDDSFRGIIEETVSGKKYEIVFIHGKVTELYIDGKRIPDEKIPEYQNTIDKIVKETRERAAKGKIDAERAYAAASAEKISAEKAMADAEMRKKSAEDEKLQVDRALGESQSVMLEAKEANERAEAEMVLARDEREKAEKDKLFSDNVITGIVSDLKKDGIVKNEKNISLSLDKTGLIVNGVKQPQPVFSRYKEKYLKNENARISFQGSGQSRIMSLQIDDKQ